MIGKGCKPSTMLLVIIAIAASRTPPATGQVTPICLEEKRTEVWRTVVASSLLAHLNALNQLQEGADIADVVLDVAFDAYSIAESIENLGDATTLAEIASGTTPGFLAGTSYLFSSQGFAVAAQFGSTFLSGIHDCILVKVKCRSWAATESVQSIIRVWQIAKWHSLTQGYNANRLIAEFFHRAEQNSWNLTFLGNTLGVPGDIGAILDRLAEELDLRYETIPTLLLYQTLPRRDLVVQSVNEFWSEVMVHGQRLAETNCVAAPKPVSPSELSAVAVSTSQINVKWLETSFSETSLTLQRAIGTDGDWLTIRRLPPNTRSYSDSDLAAGTLYRYRARTEGYDNSSGLPLPVSSAWSNAASAITRRDQVTLHRLSIHSMNPSAGVTVSSYVNSANAAFATTPTTRTFPDGSLVNVLCAEVASTKVFQKWQLDGVDYAFTPSTLLVLNSGRTLTAVYGEAAADRSLAHLSIRGPSSVDERSSAQYTAVANFADGSSAEVAANWEEDSGYGTISDSGRLDASAVSRDRVLEIVASYSVGGVGRSATKNVTIRNTDEVPNYTLNLSAQHGRVIARPDLNEYPEGTEVRLVADADDGYLLDHWSGDASGDSRTIYVTMDETKSVTANFVADLSEGTVRVYIDPPAVVAEGAGWKASGNGYFPLEYRQSGESRSLQPGRYFVSYKSIPGWVEPDNEAVELTGGATSTIYANYRELKGSLQVTLTPAAANIAGARWRIDNGPWLESGTTANEVSTGDHTLEFLPLPGWGTPPSESVAVQRNIASIRYGNYSPPAGLPIITAVSPRSGPLAGGIDVTIDGANFGPDSTVAFGGIASVAVTVVSPTQIKATSPPRASYGSVTLSVQSGSQTATQANGFSYLNALGANIELIGQIGGNVEAVAVVGNTVYYGEGPGLVVSDFTNSASPVERGRIPLPAAVKHIAVANNIAFVAAGAAGLYAVDVSISTAPSIVGFFDTEGTATGVAILATTAYVADSSSLQVLNITDPAAMVSLGSLPTGGATRVAVGAIEGRTYSFVAGGNVSGSGRKLHVVDVTDPSAPVEVSSLPAESSAGITDVKLEGTTLYVSDWSAGVKIFDASDPAHLLFTGTRDNVGPSFIDVSGTRLYTCGSGLRVADLTVSPNPANLGYFDPGSFCSDLAVINDLAFAAMGRDGLKVVAVSNPASMSLRSSIATLGGVEDVYVVGDTALVGNDAGLHTVDISNPAKPVWLASLPGERVTGIVAANGKATLVNYGDTAVRIVDITNPTVPSILSTYTGVEAWDVALLGTKPVLGAATPDVAHLPKVDVLDISSPSAPQSTGSVLLGNLAGIASAIAVEGNWAFVRIFSAGNTENAFAIVDLTNPASPQRLGSIPIADLSLVDIAASEDGEYAYAPSDQGIQVIDARIKTAPVVTTIVDPAQEPAGSSFTSVQVVSNRLYADKGASIFAFDITDPAAPKVLGYHKRPGSAFGIDGKDDLIFVAGYNAGVSIYRLKDLDLPTLTITSPTTNPAYSTTTDTVSIAGVATDNVSVTRVAWDNDRGGGGIATGTASWSIPTVQLAAGLNRITVTAEDAEVNLGTDVIEITATFPDVTPPVITITQPKPDSEFSVNTPTIDLGGSAVDDVALTTVTWTNNRGGSGFATVTDGVWSVANLALDLGPNLLQVTATDSSGNSAMASAVVFMLPPDTEAPSLTIDFPTADALLNTTDDVINISGSASDNVGVNRIEWSNSSGGSGLAQGVSPWSVKEIVLQPGLNVIEITAYDDAGNSSADALSVTYNLPTATPTETPTGTHTSSATPTSTATATAASSATATQTLTVAPSSTPTVSNTPTSTVTVTNTPSVTSTPSASATSTTTATPPPSPSPSLTYAPIPCTGDCDSSGMVTVDELVTGVSIALGTSTRDQCPAFDCNGNQQVTVDCLVEAVNAALNGCPG